MLWVGVRYRGLFLPDIMKAMRLWLDRHGYQPTSVEYEVSGSGTLVCLQFEHEVAAAVFAQEFAGRVSPHSPALEPSDSYSAFQEQD